MSIIWFRTVNSSLSLITYIIGLIDASPTYLLLYSRQISAMPIPMQQKLCHHFLCRAVVYRAKHLDCGEFINARNDSFLDAEANQLDPLHDIEPCDPYVVVG